MTVLSIGSTVAGRYFVERELAQGGFGAVYVAQHKSTEERVALKVLWPHVLQSKEAVERFQLEATVAAKVGSENIVRVLDAGFDEQLKMPFLVMELLKGKTLEQMVIQQGPFAPIEALGVLAQTASALHKAHRNRDAQGNLRPVIHRDLKPDNLFFARRENGDPCIKVLEFGIAKVLSGTSKISRDVKGTPLFMSHEQMLGNDVVPATDVWALGLIAFYLLAGKPYWVAGANPNAEMNALFAEVLHLPMEPATARARRIGATVSWPVAFDTWLARCLERDPALRCPGVAEAMEGLSIALGTTSSRPDSAALTRARATLADRNHLDESLSLAATQASAQRSAHPISSQPGSSAEARSLTGAPDPRPAPAAPPLQAASEPVVFRPFGATPSRAEASPAPRMSTPCRPGPVPAPRSRSGMVRRCEEISIWRPTSVQSPRMCRSRAPLSRATRPSPPPIGATWSPSCSRPPGGEST